MRKLLLVIVIFLIGIFVAVSHLVTTDDKELVEKLVFPEAYEVVSGYDERLGLTAISYKVKLKYPSKEVLEFCNEKLKELGWEKYILYPTKESDRNWMDFIDGTREGEPFVHQLGAYWNDKEKNKMVSLLLRYYSYGLTRKEKLYIEEPNTDVLDVIVQVGPYVDLSKTPEEILEK